MAHLDHNLRPTSHEDAQFTAQIANTWNLPIHTHTLSENALQSHPGGLEDGARHARYDFLHKIARKVTPPDQTPIVAVAHHADDQTETVIMNLVRGSGLRGLGGMKIISPIPLVQPSQSTNAILIRPLLHISKAEIQAYLHRYNLSWREDESNTDPSFLRNRLRHQIIPQLEQINPNLSTTLGRTAQLFADDMARLEKQDHNNLCKLLIEQTNHDIQTYNLTRIVLDLEKFTDFDPSSQRGIIHQVLSRLTVDPRKINFTLIENLLHALNNSRHATGPHPLTDSIAWTIAGATAGIPARLSLHKNSDSPFTIPHPHLGDQPASYTLDLTNLQANQPVICSISNGWTLQINLIPIGQLPPDWQTRNQPWRAFLDAEPIEKLHLCAAETGDRIAPLGMNGCQKNLGDLFTDHKIPTALRAGWPLIIESRHNTILWVCGLRTSHHARITEHTQKIYCLYWQQEQDYTK